MEEKSKKVKKFSTLDNELFCQADVDIISEKVENNMSILLSNDNYIDIDDKLLDLNVKLSLSLKGKDLKLFREYIDASLEAASYQNCLSYYLGLKSGINISELK